MATKIMSIYIRNFFILLTGGLFFAACSAGGNDPGVEYSPQMYHSVPYEPLSQIKDKNAGSWLSTREDGQGEFYNSNPYNLREMNMREPAPHTVSRNKYGYLPYRLPKDSLAYAAATLKNPLDTAEAILQEGKVLYTRFCWHCHGDKGLGDGPVGEVYGGVTSYTSRAVINVPEGHIFHVITHGKGRMMAHGSQISIPDRWKIVRYVQTLQKQ